eukprot:1357396-Prorocentrum_lima.AAC.1
MTSSLVGSEMCIRDRASALAGKKGPGGDGRPSLRNLVCCQVPTHLARPVSYTHLTLPTICSV